MKQLIVATDDQRIYKEVRAFGGHPVMTDPGHQSGTDRCAEALGKYQEETGNHIDVVINIQGDEPFIHQEHLESLRRCFKQPEVSLATLAILCRDESELRDPNQPKVVMDGSGDALYFSRHPIPFLREVPPENWISRQNHYRHIGTYAYRAGMLEELAKLPPSSLEKAESLEQLRWLEAGYRIRVVLTGLEAISIDTPEDLELARERGLIKTYQVQV